MPVPPQPAFVPREFGADSVRILSGPGPGPGTLCDVSYVVTVETRLPDGAVVLDPLQQVGTSTLLEHGFDAVEAIEGPDGIEIDVVETIVAVHPGGAILKVFVRAPPSRSPNTRSAPSRRTSWNVRSSWPTGWWRAARSSCTST